MEQMKFLVLENYWNNHGISIHADALDQKRWQSDVPKN
jgi:hypothetical protein